MYFPARSLPVESSNMVPEKYVIKNLQPVRNLASAVSSSFKTGFNSSSNNRSTTTSTHSSDASVNSNLNSSSASGDNSPSTAVAPPYDVSIQLARLVDIDGSTCVCPNCGDGIQQLALTAEERAGARAALRDIITERKYTRRLEQLNVRHSPHVTLCITV